MMTVVVIRWHRTVYAICGIGREARKQVPLLPVLREVRNRRTPLCFAIMRWESHTPIPVPDCLAVTYGLKSWFAISSGIPVPLSDAVMWAINPFTATRIVNLPSRSGMASTAFKIRFERTCRAVAQSQACFPEFASDCPAEFWSGTQGW
jgi:hypothetical protein